MTFTKAILSTAAVIALSTSAAFATDLNSVSDSRDAGINAQEAGAAADNNIDLTITNTIDGENGDGRIDAKEAGKDVDLSSTATTSTID